MMCGGSGQRWVLFARVVLMLLPKRKLTSVVEVEAVRDGRLTATSEEAEMRVS
jgi:hypothetical protein